VPLPTVQAIDVLSSSALASTHRDRDCRRSFTAYHGRMLVAFYGRRLPVMTDGNREYPQVARLALFILS